MIQNANGVHELIAKTAKEFAGAFYDDRARDNVFFAEWPNERNFIRKNWKSFIGPARQVLTHMLGQSNRTAHEKEQIYEALLLDGAINPKGAHNSSLILH